MPQLLWIFISVLITVAADYAPFYRKDYTFLEDFNAFYKIHFDEEVTWNSAFMSCDDEGAQLFYPKEKGEWAVVKNLSTMIHDIYNVTDVLVGIHDEIGLGEFITVDGHSTPSALNVGEETSEGDCVIMDLQTGAFKIEPCTKDPKTKRLFACKKVDEKPCPTIDLNYKYSKETKKCYKMSKRDKTWHEAWHTCYMEGGLLLSVETPTEANIVKEFMRQLTSDNVFVGFRRMFPSKDFYNVKGKKLSELSYNSWYDRTDQGQEDCGAIMFYSDTLYLRTRACHERLPFACEMKANELM